MKSFLQIFLFFLFVSQISFAQLEFYNKEQPQKISSGQLTNALSVNLDSLMLDSIIIAYKNSQSIPGIATMIVKDNEVIWNKNYGYRNLQNQLSVEDSTIFLMASISKPILATAVMQLWENGMINLENNINDYLPSSFSIKNPLYPNDTITVKMLLVHTSSIQDNWNILIPLEVCGDSPMRLDSFLVNHLMPGGTYYSPGNFYNYHPGQQWNYSNVGASLLAIMIEHLTGKSFSEYCRDSIFIPLSMNSTSWFLEGLDPNQIATPYNVSTPLCHQGWVLYPAGFLRTNKIDLSKFLLAYINNGVYNNFRMLDSTTISYMLSDQLGYNIVWESPSWIWKQGLIWWNVFPISKNSWGHVGSWYGCLTYMCYDPIEKWGTIWFQNWRLGDNNFTRLGEINYPFTNYAHLYGNIYAQNPNVEKRYAKISIDSVLFRTRFSNIYNHQFTPQLIHANLNGTQIDSLTLFDDGMHGDSAASDGLYGNYIPPIPIEDFFKLGVSTIDHQTNKYFITTNISSFATVGPVIVDSLYAAFQPAHLRFAFRPYLRNLSTKFQILNPSVIITCNDSMITNITQNKLIAPTISPEQRVACLGATSIYYDPSKVKDTLTFNIHFEIYSDGFVYWNMDTTVSFILTGIEEGLIVPTAYKLEQNYPNPFNPTTTIGFGMPEKGNVRLSVLNVLGEEIKILLNEEKEAGYHSVEFNGANVPSGVYFYRVQSGNFIDTKKMILLK